jgi:two-component system, OmpR family, response regulator
MLNNAELSVLVVDDDEAILDALSSYLSRRGCRVSTARSGTDLDNVLSKEVVDVVVLDLMMPGEDGLSICRRLADKHSIIMLSAIGDVPDRVIGLEMGASDYLAKPFDPRELLARIRSAARRSATVAERINKQTFAFDGWLLDVDERKLANPEGSIVPLSGGEFQMLHAFVQRPQRLLTREMLLSTTLGHDADVFDRAIDVTISRLRRKLKWPDQSSPIETIRGEGYRFRPVVKRR